MSNLERFGGMLGDSTMSWRDDVFNDKFDGIVIDTCYTPDVRKWETGIERDGEAWVIVEEYKDRGEAQLSHKNWVKKLKKNRKMELTECRSAFDWFLGDD